MKPSSATTEIRARVLDRRPSPATTPCSFILPHECPKLTLIPYAPILLFPARIPSVVFAFSAPLTKCSCPFAVNPFLATFPCALFAVIR